MLSMILETLFSITLLISGGHLVSTNFKLHHYSCLLYTSPSPRD